MSMRTSAFATSADQVADGSSPVASDSNTARQRMASEVLELGQALFDAMLEAAATSQTGIDTPYEPLPIDALRAAADEFFMALRLLLNAEERA